VRCTRNLLEFEEDQSEIVAGYWIQDFDRDFDDDSGDSEDSEDEDHNLTSVGGILGDENNVNFATGA
jgi:hypothetical protein